jgi:hypothetical protein
VNRTSPTICSAPWNAATSAGSGELWNDDIAVWHSGDRADNDFDRAFRVIRWFLDRTRQRRYSGCSTAGRWELRPAAHPARHRHRRAVLEMRCAS